MHGIRRYVFKTLLKKNKWVDQFAGGFFFKTKVWFSLSVIHRLYVSCNQLSVLRCSCVRSRQRDREHVRNSG